MSPPATPLPVDASVAPGTGRPRWLCWGHGWRHGWWRSWWRSGWPPLLLAVGVAGAYAALVALPSHVAGLERIPLTELTAGEASRELWPGDRGGGWASFRLVGAVTFLVGPVVALGAFAWAAVRTREGITAGDLLRTGPALLAAAISLGTVAWLFSPLGRALTAWFLG